jgi:hypothetical protein
MKDLSGTLTAAQKKPDRLPYVEAKVYDFEQGIKRLSWERLYAGSEPDNHHGIAFDGQGSMHRIRADSGNKLYHQKIPDPSPQSQFSNWTQLAADCYGPCAIAAHGAKVYIFYRTTANVLWKYYSHNYGQDWSNGQLVDYADVLSMAATWWGTGNIVVCFALKAGQQNGIVLDSSDQSTTEHTWLGSVNHPFSTTLGIGASYTPDHVDIVIAALEAGDPYNLYGLYRQQFDNTYTFTDVEPFITAPQGEDVTYEYPDCHNPASAQDYENTQIVAVEKFTGTTAYTRPLICHSVRGSAFSSMAFTEPKPFLNISSAYGLRLQSTSSYWWLERPDGVWRAPRAAGDPLDLTDDILDARQVTPGELTITLDNSKAQYAAPPAKRSEVVLKLGYKTSQGSEAVEVGRYWIDSWEYSSTPNTSTLTLVCLDGWGLADKWSARFQMRWPATKRVWEIIQEIICRWGINLTIPAGVPKSSAVDNLYPDFTLQPGTRGDAVLRRVLSFIPDGLIFDGNEAYVKDLQDDEASSYSYGTDHVILSGEYSQAVSLTRARAIGRDDEDNRIVEDAFDWDNLQLGIDILEQDYDPNLGSAARAQERADAILRKESLRTQGGQITIPVNCGQELYDVITITDTRCGISSKKYRVLDIETALSLRQWLYEQRLTVGAP